MHTPEQPEEKSKGKVSMQIDFIWLCYGGCYSSFNTILICNFFIIGCTTRSVQTKK